MAAYREKIKKNPMAKIKSLKLDKKGARQALTVEELERLRDACQGYREKALVEFLVSSGCRLSEVAQLNVSDLDLIGRTVRVTGKGDKDRQVYFSVRARLMVQEYMVSRKGGTGLFVSSKSPYEPLNLGRYSVLSAQSARGQDWKSTSTRTCCAIPSQRTRSMAAWT